MTTTAKETKLWIRAPDVLFDAKNDLVVDTASMDDLQEHLRIPGARMCNFMTSDVHHCSYVAQPRTYDFLRRVAFI